MSAKVLTPPDVHPLSQRERQALLLYGSGYSYEEIAGEMGTSEHTVKNQLDIARQKLKVKKSSDAYVALMRAERKAK